MFSLYGGFHTLVLQGDQWPSGQPSQCGAPPPLQLWAASHGTWSQLDDGQEEGKGLPNNSVSHKILQGGMKPWV